jgi:hypothetical protein
MYYSRSMALTIGLDKYQHQPRLPGAVRNADGVASCLRWRYKFDVSSLADAQATRGAVSRELARLAEADRVIVYYAGRALDDDTLCLYSTEAGVSNSGLSLTRLLRGLDASPSKHILVILDAAIERPAMLEPIAISAGALASGSGPLPAQDLAAHFAERGRVVLASGPTAWTMRERWGDEDATPFTAQVIHGLRGSAADANGAISARTLSDYVGIELPKNSGGKAGMWAAALPGAGGDLVFREMAPPALPYDIENGLRSGSSFHRYRAVELLAYLVDKADPIQSVMAIDRLREVANDNDSVNVRKMAVDELLIRGIDPYAGDVPMLREPPEPRSGGADSPAPSNLPAPPLPGDRRQTILVGVVMFAVFATVAFLIWYFR